MLENLEVIIDNNRQVLFGENLRTDKLIDAERNAECLIKIGYNSNKDLIFYEKIKTFFTDKSVEKDFSYENYNWNVLFKIERDELVKYEKEEPGFDNFLKEFKERIKKNYDYFISEGLIHHIKEPNYYFENDLFAIKSDYLDDEYIFTASHEFEVEIQNRGLRYIKEYKRNE